MIAGFQNAWPIWLAIVAGVILVVVGILSYRHFRGLISGGHLVLLTALRICGVILLLLLLLSPFREEKTPDPNAFRVALLADSSGSMSARDVGDNRTRFDVVEDLLTGDGQAPAVLERGGQPGQSFPRTRPAQFSDRLDFLNPGEPLTMLPGRTAIGESLQQGSDRVNADAGQQLGAVVLMSDGQNNEGVSPVEVAKQFQARGVPISTVGVGRDRTPGDVRVAFLKDFTEGASGEPLAMSARLTNTFPGARTVTVNLQRDDVPVDQRQVTLQPGQEQIIEFTDDPISGGDIVYRLKIDSENPDPNPSTDLDYLLASVREPLVFEFFYLADNPGWEQRFLQRAAESEEQLRLKSIIRTGPKSFLLSGFDEADAAESLRQDEEQVRDMLATNFLTDLDGIILQADAANLLPGESIERIVNFTANNGGGLLVMGDPEDLPPALRQILPARETKPVQTDRDVPLRITSETFFAAPGQPSPLVRGAPLFIPQQEPVRLLNDLKPIARSLLEAEEGGEVFLAAQAYGSGRVAYLGAPITWVWRMQNADGLAQHRNFWNGFLSWLGSSSRPRLETPVHGRQMAVDEVADLSVIVQGADFRPSTNAKVAAIVTAPDGTRQRINLSPSIRISGQYEAEFLPGAPGEYEVDYRIAFPEGDEIDRKVFFTSSFQGAETETIAFREDVMRDVARITGGRYVSYEDTRALQDLPLAGDLPVSTRQIQLTTNWLFLALLAGVISAEWIIRRRIGMR